MRKAVLRFIAMVSFVAGLSACGDKYITEPVEYRTTVVKDTVHDTLRVIVNHFDTTFVFKHDYYVSADTATYTLPFVVTVGSGWGFGVRVVVTGNVDLPSGEFKYSIDTPGLVKVTVSDWSREPGNSMYGDPITIFSESVSLQGLAPGTAKVTFWHPSDPTKKKTFVMVLR